MTKEFEIQENSLELVVTEKTLGNLTTNIKAIKQMVAKAISNYDISNYDESKIDIAKKDRAMFNKVAKSLNDKRIAIEKEFMKPFAEFKNEVSETVDIIKEASNKIDELVKTHEQKEKDEKHTAIAELWANKNFNLVELEKIFNSKWLNKGYDLQDIEKDLDDAIVKVKNDLIVIEKLGDDKELLTSIYLGNLNLSYAVQYAEILKANREKAKSIQSKPQAIEPVVSEKVSNENEILTRTFKVITTKSNIIALAEFMREKQITFEKV